MLLDIQGYYRPPPPPPHTKLEDIAGKNFFWKEWKWSHCKRGREILHSLDCQTSKQGILFLMYIAVHPEIWGKGTGFIWLLYSFQCALDLHFLGWSGGSGKEMFANLIEILIGTYQGKHFPTSMHAAKQSHVAVKKEFLMCWEAWQFPSQQLSFLPAVLTHTTPWCCKSQIPKAMHQFRKKTWDGHKNYEIGNP